MRHPTIFLYLCIVLMILLGSCQSYDTHVSDSSSTPNTTLHTVQTFPLVTNENGDYVLPEPVTRTAWNIELSIASIEDDCIWIEIRDNDNQGLELSLTHYQMEKKVGDEWVVIVKYNPDKAHETLVNMIPATSRDYQTTNAIIMNPKDSGTYRVTKYLSGKPFTLEFELP